MAKRFEALLAPAVLLALAVLLANDFVLKPALHDGLTGKVLKQPERDEIDTPVQESLIVELYSK